MKKAIFFIASMILLVESKGQIWDLPSPTPHLQTLPSGSYVIAMDNAQQVNTAGEFNLKAYGLIVHLLNNNVKIKWVIRAGKLKDGIDFSGLAEPVKPSLIPGGTLRDFKAGPFVINAGDLAGVDALIDAYYTSNSLTGNNRPQVYRLTSAVANVDVRYDLYTFKPKAAILTDGGNAAIHVAYMTAAGIPAINYATSTGTGLSSSCFTFASEPHNTATGAAVNATISAIKAFVQNGGNFLAQCEAVNNYENNALGRFQTSTGIVTSNAAIGTACAYPNPDLAFSQFEGAFNASLGGSLRNWQILDAPTYGAHSHATGTGGFSASIGASVSKITNHVYGGLVFYIGNHSFSATGLTNINGLRMYMNAFLTPSLTNCPSQPYWVLPVRITSFSGKLLNNGCQLNWTVEENESGKVFEVEKSVDGRGFISCGYVFCTSAKGVASYQFFEDKLYEDVFFRIKMTDLNGKIRFSQMIRLQDQLQNTKNKLIVNNISNGSAEITYKADSQSVVLVNVYNSIGATVISYKKQCYKGINNFTIPLRSLGFGSVFMVEIVNKKERLIVKSIND